MCNKSWLAAIVLLCGTVIITTEADSDSGQIYRMCVPHKYYQDCIDLLKDPSEAGIRMECVSGRDRIDCLDMINQRKADVLASEPEDMYVAYHTKNQDYRVISEIRTKDDKDAAFRYEGIILVKKSSPIKTLKDLYGAKSCHTGFGRNVGYRIPITKLKNANILKVSMEADMAATERELEALSKFFSESCLVGTYSPYPEVDRVLKQKYSNLCSLCEKPAQCNYPDKFSGYDGAIRCLDKGKGEVAFSKVQFVKKYFGMKPGTTAEGNPDEFEYLCEDGTRRALSGPACSWAQRPWTGYISNEDAVANTEKLHQLQNRLEKFFENGLHAENKVAASHLLINENAVYHSKPEAVMPQEYLERAGYKDVIERDGSAIRKMKLCVQTDVEMSKCDAMRRAAYSRDVRPTLECVQENDCMRAVKEGKADLVAVTGNGYVEARDYQLKPIVYESFAENDVNVVVVEPSLSAAAIQTEPVKFDVNDARARLSAAYLNKRRGLEFCTMTSSSESNMEVVRASDLEKYKNKQLLCPDLERKPVTESATCNFDVHLPVAVFIRSSMTPVEQETIKHLLISLSSKFGQNGKQADVFTLFGEYQQNAHNVLFNDDAIEFVTEPKHSPIAENVLNELKCGTNKITKN